MIEICMDPIAAVCMHMYARHLGAHVGHVELQYRSNGQFLLEETKE